MDIRLSRHSPSLWQIRVTLRVRTGTKVEGQTSKKVTDPSCQENPRSASTVNLTVPQTDTGRWGENPKAHVRMLVQELGKLAP